MHWWLCLVVPPVFSFHFFSLLLALWLKHRRKGGKYWIKTMPRAPASAFQLFQGLCPAQHHLGGVGPTGCGCIPKISQGLNAVWEEHAEVPGRCKVKSPSGTQAESPELIFCPSSASSPWLSCVGSDSRMPEGDLYLSRGQIQGCAEPHPLLGRGTGWIWKRGGSSGRSESGRTRELSLQGGGCGNRTPF